MGLPISLPVIERTVIDHSMSDTLDACPRLFLYKYGFNKRSNSEESISMDFGTHYHTYREQLDKLALQDPEAPEFVIHMTALTEALKGFEDPPEDHKHKYLDTTRLKKSCEKGFERWRNERKFGSHKILQSEVSFETALPSGRLYGGRFDQILEWNKQLWVRDFKTTSWLAGNINDKYALNHQMSGYIWGMEQLSGLRIAGALVEILHNTSKVVADIKMVMTTRTEQDINNFIDWAEDRWDEYEHRLKTSNWPMRTRSCGDYNKRCSFWDACSKGDYDAVETWLAQNAVENVWDFTDPKGEKAQNVEKD